MSQTKELLAEHNLRKAAEKNNRTRNLAPSRAKAARTAERNRVIAAAMDVGMRGAEELCEHVKRERPDLLCVKKGSARFIDAESMMRAYRRPTPAEE